MNKTDIDKLKAIIKDEQKEYEEDAGHDYWAQGWYQGLQWALDEIEKLDFDFATVGCGGFSLPVCNFIKTVMKRPCVHLGGGNQLLFGIIGKRWDDNETFSMLFNKHWTKPLKHEVPTNNQLVEQGCYW